MPAYYSESDLNLAEFDTLCSQRVSLADYPAASDVQNNVVIYSGERLRAMLGDAAERAALIAEFARCLKDGPGVFAIQGAYKDVSIIDRTTVLFERLIAAEKASGQGKGDHFGTNERVWNSIQKQCIADPDLYIDYYGHPLLALACEAWLGPYYQMTAQVNNVKPGGKAQSAHRDYHLGFQSAETVAQFPAHAQAMSQYLTLQGGIAHCDMPLLSGPTLFLPFSQQYEPGYMAYTRPEFADYFDKHKVQIPFKKGDMVFFSPALFHGAGTNQGTTDRLVNLVQVSSAFGRTMETLNTHAMIEAVYPALQARIAEGTVSEQWVNHTIAAAADGYSFPTNLDSDPPIGGNAPITDQQLMRQGLTEGWTWTQLQEQLNARLNRRRA